MGVSLEEIDRTQLAEDQFVFSSFNHTWLLEIRKRRPEIKLEALLGYPEIRPLNWGELEFDTYNVNSKLTNADEVKQITNKGIQVNLYNIEDKDEINQFVAAGATGFITDYPKMMSEMGYRRN